MTEVPSVESAISQRARLATDVAGSSSTSITSDHGASDPDPGLLKCLGHHLHAGETHYPVRPGMTSLRERVDAQVSKLGLPSRGASAVLITASEGEALFVTLLGLGAVPGGTVRGLVPAEHQSLLTWTGVSITGLEYEGDPDPSARVIVIGTALFGGDHAVLEPTDIIIGSLRGLEGMRPFTLGFVAASPDTLTKITKWKQASSICSPAPSQRAALWAFGVRP